MTDRLKQIWSGFESATTRKLTGRGVDNIAVPHRQDWRAEDNQFLPEGYAAPASVAFDALKQRLAKGEKKARRRAGRKGEIEAAPEAAFAPEILASRDLIRGLKATEARIARSDIDYVDYLASAPARKGLFSRGGAPRVKGARKKFLGIF